MATSCFPSLYALTWYQLTEVRLKEGKSQDESVLSNASDVERTPTKPLPSSVADLGHQIQELGQLIDTLKEDRAIWREAIDSEKSVRFHLYNVCLVSDVLVVAPKVSRDVPQPTAYCGGGVRSVGSLHLA